jgi:NADPH2:quinone reductase
MRAAICHGWDGPEGLRIEEVREPSPGPGEVLIEVRAAGLNTTDLLLLAGRHQTSREIPLPYIPGLEASGVVAACGEGVDHVKPRDRVMGLLPHGGLADRAVAKGSEVIAIPASLGFEAAGGLPVSFVSAHLALHWNGRLEAGETLLVLGSSSGVGLAAVQVGKAIGARVIAGASNDEKLAFAQANGADELVNYRTVDLKSRVMELTDGRGVDVCFDPVGGALADAALSCLGWGGRILLLGFVGGMHSLPANRLLVKNRSAIGCSGRHFRLHYVDRLQATLRALCGWADEGKVEPRIGGRFPLERCHEAFQRLADGRVLGKVVVIPSLGCPGPAPG